MRPVLLGVRLDGTKELIALAEGLRESTESWADLLRDCRRRGMRDPELVIGGLEHRVERRGRDQGVQQFQPVADLSAGRPLRANR